MKVFILCGGKGTRLRPYTYEIPKVMMEVGGKPILEYVIENLKAHNITEMVFTTGYLKEKVREYFGDGKKFGVKIEYLEEKTPQNTAGSILPYKGKIKEDFLVVMGDHITNINFTKLIEKHKKDGKIATIALKDLEMELEYGVVEIDNGIISGFKEKPKIRRNINTAIYVFKPEIFDYIKGKEDFAKDVFPRMLKEKKEITAYVFEEMWTDIGRIKDYEEMNKKMNLEKFKKILKV